jgi:hypothetical protein
LSVAVFDTSELEQLLRGRSSDQASTSWGRDQTSNDGTALSGDLQ